MKRKLLDINIIQKNKKFKTDLWINATDTRNFMINDPLVDWLILTRQKPERTEFNKYIIQKGNEFENWIIESIKSKIPIITVSNRITDESCQQTINLMKNGTPIIHSAPFKIHERRIKGIIDILIRSDYIGKIVENNPLPKHLETYKAPFLNGNYHYLVIDIKFSTLRFCSDGIHLLNSKNCPAYKAQNWIYTQGIGNIQGYTSNYSYILGRRWKFTRNEEIFSSIKCDEKLGVIDYSGKDSCYIQKTEDAISWLLDLSQNGKKWTLNPPSKNELYPNMCIDSGRWESEKKEIAKQIGDITMIWKCGTKERQNALRAGINTWKNIKCSSNILGKPSLIIDKIMDINRQNTDLILPKKIKTNLYDWSTIDNEMFVDFETFTDIFAEFGEFLIQPISSSIFMIGTFYKGEYKRFTVENISFEEEQRIMKEFINFVKVNNSPKLWFWSAEKIIWEKKQKNQNFIGRWADLSKIFQTEPIVIKDCFKFGLKEVSSAMRNHGMIHTHIESKCDSGLSASIKAWEAFQKTTYDRDIIISDIAEYNKFDVKVLWEILTYLRKNLSM